jgi:hypothetical protein
MSADSAAGMRVLALAWFGQLALSSGLLLWASTGHRVVPLWCGVLDVTLALTFIGTSGVLRARRDRCPVGDPLRREQVGRLARASVPSLVLLGLWLIRDGLDWNVLLPGLAWRLFFVLYLL